MVSVVPLVSLLLLLFGFIRFYGMVKLKAPRLNPVSENPKTLEVSKPFTSRYSYIFEMWLVKMVTDGRV